MTTTNNRKVLVPLATLLAAGAVAIGSGATWTSSSTSAVEVTSGTLVHDNDRDGLTLTAGNLKPGDVLSGTATVENTGTLDSTLDLTSANVSTTFVDGPSVDSPLDIEVEQTVGGTTTTLYNGDFLELDVDEQDLTFDEGDVYTYTFTVSLASNAADTNQGKTAYADFDFVSRQLAGENIVDNWL